MPPATHFPTSPVLSSLHAVAASRAQARYNAGPGSKRPRSPPSDKALAKKERKIASAYRSRFRKEALEEILEERVESGSSEVEALAALVDKVARENREMQAMVSEMKREVEDRRRNEERRVVEMRRAMGMRQAMEEKRARGHGAGSVASPGSVGSAVTAVEAEVEMEGLLDEGVEDFLLSGLGKAGDGWSMVDIVFDPALDLSGMIVVNAPAR